MTEKERVEELEERVEELTEELEKVKERKSGEAQEKEVGEIQDQIKDAAEESGISRRKFMKMIGGGVAGLSTAAVLPSVSGFTFKDDKSFKFGNMSSSQTNMEVGTGGDLDMHENNISNLGSLTGINDHINLKNRGGEKAAPENGLSFYVDDDKLKGVSADGNRTVPIESVDVESVSSSSLPTVRLWQDGDEIVAVGPDGEVARGTELANVVSTAEESLPVPSVSESKSFEFERFADFESTTNWSALRGDESLSTVSDSQEGSASLEVAGGTSNNPGITTSFTEEDWQAFDTLKLWAKADSQVDLVVEVVSDANNDTVELRETIDTGGSWQEIEVTLQIGELITPATVETEVDRVNIYAETPTDSFTFQVDDLRIIEQYDLEHDSLESISADVGTQGTDWLVDERFGVVTPVVDGSISSGQSVSFDYNYYQGGTLKLVEGDYRVDETVQLTAPKTELVGESWSARLYRGNTQKPVECLGDFTALRNLQIDGRGKNGGVEQHNIEIRAEGHSIGEAAAADIVGVTVENVWSHHATGDGVETKGSEHRIINNRFEHNREQEIHVRVGNGVIVRGNQCLSQETKYAIRFSDSGNASEPIADFRCSNNFIDGSGFGGIVVGSKCDGGRIEGNTIKNVGKVDRNDFHQVGIRVSGGAKNVEITDDTIRDSYGTGVYALAEGTRISEVTVRNVTERGIWIDANNVRVERCHAEQCGREGLIMIGTADLVAVGNEIRNCNQSTEVADEGIEFYSSSSFTRCRMRNNTVVSTDSQQHWNGIEWLNGTFDGGCEMSSNFVDGTGGEAIPRGPPNSYDNTPAYEQDLTSVAAPSTDGARAWHDGTDGTNTNVKGPAVSRGGSWVSLISGNTIA